MVDFLADIGERFGDAWRWLNGKKTAIGGAMMVAGRLPVVPPEWQAFLSEAGSMITALGLGHKVSKSEAVKNAIDKARKRKQG